jgi:serine/threonine protein kinase/tetratricopeptide (TPR) repeat protein
MSASNNPVETIGKQDDDPTIKGTNSKSDSVSHSRDGNCSIGPTSVPKPLLSAAVSCLIEFRQRRAAGDKISARKFVDQENISDPEIVVDLAFEELLDEERNGKKGFEEQICRDFPEHATEIRRQIFFHRALQDFDTGNEANETVLSGTVPMANRSVPADSSPVPEISGLKMVRQIGRGGMGVVYLAEQPALSRQVAVKLLLSGAWASKEIRARFRAEAQMAASLRHPNIVQVYEVGESAGQPFLIMEYVGNGTLDGLIATQRVAFRDATEAVRTLAMTLHETHKVGIFHRDLKPGNILLSRRSDGVSGQTDQGKVSLADFMPKITDFGLAKFQQEEQALSGPTLTLAGDILGTPSYMAPEQTQGNATGPWTDVYSLGAILYEMLAGKPPYQATTPWETLQKLMKDDPSPLPRDIPLDLRTICHKCLMRRPQDRYTSMHALAEDLQRYLEGKPIRARRVSMLERASSWCQRNRAVTALTTLVVVALSTLLGVTLWSRSQLKDLLVEMADSRKNESDARADAVAHLWDSLISEARAQQTSGQAGSRTESLNAISKAIELLPQVGETHQRKAAIRDASIAAMALSEMKSIGTWKGPSLPTTIALATDGRLNRVAQFHGDRVTITENLGETLVKVFPVPGVSQLSMSDDGRWLAAFGESCKLFDLNQAETQATAEFPSGGYWGFSPDGSRLVGSTKDGLVVFNTATNQIEHRIQKISTDYPLAFARDNRKVAIQYGESIWVLDFLSGEKLNELPAGKSQLGNHCLAWHPDNNRLAAAVYDKDSIHLWDVTTAQIVRTFRDRGSAISMAFDHAGEHLLFCSLWGGALKVFNVESESPVLSLQATNTTRFVATETGVRAIMSTGREKHDCWEFVPQKILQTLATQRSRETECLLVDVSPTSNWAVVGTVNGMELFDRHTKKLGANLEVGIVDNSQICFDVLGRLWSCQDKNWIRWEIKDGVLHATKPFRQTSEFWPIQINHSGDWTLTSNSWEVRLESLAEPGKVILLGVHQDVRRSDFSCDGRWVATGAWNGNDTKIWSMKDGHLVNTLKTGPVSVPRFSPDSRWLVTSENGGVLWDTSDWSVALRLNAPGSVSSGLVFAFSPDSRWLVNSRLNGELQVWDLQTKASLGILKDPNQFRVESLAFSPDQRELYCIRKDTSAFVSVWNLGVLEDELKKLNVELALELKPEAASAEITQTNFRPLIVEKNEILTSLFGTKLSIDAQKALDSGDWKQGLELYRQAADVNSDNAQILNSLAWNLVVCPPEFRDSATAVDLASRAVRIDGNPIYLNTLGTAQYRSGQFKEALETLKKSLGDGSADAAAFDYYTLSCCYANLGEHELAQQMLSSGIAAYDRVRTAIPEQWNRELRQFRAEAESALATLKK